MHLILTHEQADFDAIGSLKAAMILHPEAEAVLPRQVNRNVMAYCSHYAAELGFGSFQTLSGRGIELITLVDTQSLVTVKGYSDKTQVNVVDHHPRKAQTNSDWHYQLETTGACTTLLVEQIREKGLAFNQTAATLMLLGIYEDTGSLTYASTTPRDAYATAFLLEHGADLNLVSTYLNPPLSNAQQQLYDRLLRDLVSLDIENHVVLLAKANALDITDEISSVAHKMREFLNPDGLVLLVATRQGIRLVARSTTDDINMAQLARHFGGGGHRRAASALIRSESKAKAADASALRKIADEVVEMLPQIVISAIRVSQIMSQHPLTLDPETSAEEARQLMERYGFEGYPVVKDGKVIGLLNRRNVDRAIAHKLDLDAGSLMNSGQITIEPEASVNELQDLMAESGWGQVPVVDPSTGEVIGIVTRTDIIKAHAKPIQLPSREQVVELLRQVIPPARLALLELVASEARQLGVAAYIVGGFVRDLLLNRPSLDFDVVIEGDAIRFARHLAEKYGGRVVAHKRFVTAKWLIGDQKPLLGRQMELLAEEMAAELPDSLDLITARTEFYDHPAALPTIERSSIKMDLHRRDFAINTLALRLDGDNFGRLFDYWGGYADLQTGKIRVLHALSFVDDATRMLRAVRFAVRFDFEIEERTLELMGDSMALIGELSGARLYHELSLILNERKSVAMLDRLNALGILAATGAPLPWDKVTTGRLQTLNDGLGKQFTADPAVAQDSLNLRQIFSYCLWLEGLDELSLKQVSKRLRMQARLIDSIRQTGRLRKALPGLVGRPVSEVVRELEKYHAIPLQAVRVSTANPTERELIERYLDEWQAVKPLTTGKDLRKLGIPPSGYYEKVLSALRDAWLDGKVDTPEAEANLLKRLLEER